MNVLNYYRQWWRVRHQVARRLPAWVTLLGYTISPLVVIPLKFLVSPPFLKPWLTKIPIVIEVCPQADGKIDPKLLCEYRSIFYDGGAKLPPGLRDIRLAFAAARDSQVWFEQVTVRLGPVYLTLPAFFLEYDLNAARDTWRLQLNWYHPHILYGTAVIRSPKESIRIEFELFALKPFAPIVRALINNAFEVYEKSLQEQWPVWLASRKG